MPRTSRLVVPGLLHHITQRGNNRTLTFLEDEHRFRYLSLIHHYSVKCQVDIFGFCLMPNHIHLVAKPADANGLAQLLRRAHSEYAQWFNKQAGRIGHLWQNRYFSCALERAHVYNALRYVDMNPVRSNLVANACDWRWSSARAHCDGGRDEFGLTAIEEMATWRDLPDWAALLGAIDSEADQRVRTHTRQGHPIGSRGFLKALEGASQRRLSPRPSGRPPGRVGRNTYEAA